MDRRRAHGSAQSYRAGYGSPLPIRPPRRVHGAAADRESAGGVSRAGGLTAEEMLALTREMGFSETTFVFPAETPGDGLPGPDLRPEREPRDRGGGTSDDRHRLRPRPARADRAGARPRRPCPRDRADPGGAGVGREPPEVCLDGAARARVRRYVDRPRGGGRSARNRGGRHRADPSSRPAGLLWRPIPARPGRDARGGRSRDAGSRRHGAVAGGGRPRAPRRLRLLPRARRGRRHSLQPHVRLRRGGGSGDRERQRSPGGVPGASRGRPARARGASGQPSGGQDGTTERGPYRGDGLARRESRVSASAAPPCSSRKGR